MKYIPEMEVVHVKPREGVDLSDWTIEPMQDGGTGMGSALMEELDPAFHAHVCETLGVEGYTFLKEDGLEKIVLGDWLFGDGDDVEEYLVVDGRVQPEKLKS